MISAAIRQRYLRDSLPTRIGGLAADLARLSSCAGNPLNQQAVRSLLEEGKYFAEWSAPDAPPEVQAELAEVQVTLAVWERRWLAGNPAPTMQAEAREWSDRLLKLAGFS